MKKIMKLLTAMFMVMSTVSIMPLYAKSAKLSVAKSVTYYYCDSGDFYYLEGDIDIKNISRTAKISSAKLIGAPSFYGVQIGKNKYTKKPFINVDMDSKKPANTSFKLTFNVRQNGKTTRLSTTIKIRPFLGFKSFTINGKSYRSAFKKGRLYASIKLAGTHPVIKYQMRKPYRNGDYFGNTAITVSQLDQSTKNEEYPSYKDLKYSKVKKLQKGDILYIQYMKKYWEKPEAYVITVI